MLCDDAAPLKIKKTVASHNVTVYDDTVGCSPTRHGSPRDDAVNSSIKSWGLTGRAFKMV